jgi:gamma-glutamyltranspeptidase
LLKLFRLSTKLAVYIPSFFSAKRITSISCIFMVIGGHFSVTAQEVREPEAATGLYEKQAVTGKDFMVAAANPYASKAGYNILKQGGSAIDAAIAVQLVLTLVEPQSSGIGGGAFMLHWDNKNKKLTSFDGRETAPATATNRLFLDEKGKKNSLDQSRGWWSFCWRSRGIGGIVSSSSAIRTIALGEVV